LEATLAREAKALLGGDVELRAARPLPVEADAAVARLATAGAHIVRMRELVGMARSPRNGASVLVELKAPSADYPLYGRLTTTPPAPLASLLDGDGAVVQRDLHDRRNRRDRAGPDGEPRDPGAARVPVSSCPRA